MEDKQLVSEDEDSDLELYGDPGIASKDAKPPTWLVFSNWFFTFLGIVWFFLFWNGSFGWFDRGYWSELQRAANTTYPYTTWQLVQEKAAEKEESINLKTEN